MALIKQSFKKHIESFHKQNPIKKTGNIKKTVSKSKPKASPKSSTKISTKTKNSPKVKFEGKSII